MTDGCPDEMTDMVEDLQHVDSDIKKTIFLMAEIDIFGTLKNMSQIKWIKLGNL